MGCLPLMTRRTSLNVITADRIPSAAVMECWVGVPAVKCVFWNTISGCLLAKLSVLYVCMKKYEYLVKSEFFLCSDNAEGQEETRVQVCHEGIFGQLSGCGVLKGYAVPE